MYFQENNIAKAEPKLDASSGIKLHAFNGGLTSGYFARGSNVLPKQGDQMPWGGGVNYIKDLLTLYFKGLDTRCMEFTTGDKKNH